MPIYQRGSHGQAVAKIQKRLKQLGLYLGPIDLDFGGGTESAVKLFQQQNNLADDGKVGQKTWDALFPQTEIPASPLINKPLTYRCLALTGAFETSTPPPECFAGLTGDFDGQGISFGVLQWNIKQGSLQPLLKEMNQNHPEIFDDIFHDHANTLRAVLTKPLAKQMEWARSIQSPKKQVVEPWKGLFKALGRTETYQDIQVENAAQNFQKARDWCADYGLFSERAVALMFDIRTQNGSISNAVKALIKSDFNQIGSGTAETIEIKRLRIIANRRADAANPKWREDVRKRKLTIANGEGDVHGRHYNLADDYGIGLVAF
jgi:peptidoglycan hydrolase-like protein with peptidoglycan-binding domain